MQRSQKWLIASDIHGSAAYCRQLMEHFEAEKADRLILLGDLLYHGPRNDLPKEYDPRQVAATLNRYKDRIWCVRGNCDADIDQAVLDFPILASYAIFRLSQRTIFATHGHLLEGYNTPRLQPSDILLCGHTHVPACDQLEDCIYLNPGSVSIPKEDSPRSFMTLENDHFVWKKLENGEVFRSWQAAGED